MQIRFSRLYSSVALTLVNAALLFAVLNLLAWALLVLRPQDPITTTYGERSLDDVYPGWTRDDVRRLLLETWSRGPAFAPFRVSREGPYSGRFVNIHRAGFRVGSDQGPWPPDPERLNVFVFGGSTTFGYGVADGEAFASALQRWLAPRVAPRGVACYNFGAGGYFSTQEQILFERLLLRGGVPDLAIFVDGLNDLVFSQPWLTQPLEAYLEAPVRTSLGSLVEHLPLTRVVSRLKAGQGRGPAGDISRYDDPALLNRRLRRYEANRRLITSVAADRGVQVLFVWQPVALYRYDLGQQPFADRDFGKNNYVRFGYPLFAERLRQSPPGPDFFWAADMQEGLPGPLYVDQVHYTGAMTARFAELVGTALAERGILAAALDGPQMLQPPSMETAVPDTKADSSEAR